MCHLLHESPLCRCVAHLGEVPPVPFLNPHRVSVDLLVQLVQQADSLDDHGVDLIGGELELVAGEGVGEAEGHGLEVGRGDLVGHKGLHVLADAAEDLEANVVAERKGRREEG